MAAEKEAAEWVAVGMEVAVKAMVVVRARGAMEVGEGMEAAAEEARVKAAVSEVAMAVVDEVAAKLGMEAASLAVRAVEMEEAAVADCRHI